MSHCRIRLFKVSEDTGLRRYRRMVSMAMVKKIQLHLEPLGREKDADRAGMLSNVLCGAN
jgi:hypothetical protein